MTQTDAQKAAIETAITEGHIVAETDEVKIAAKSSPTGKDETREYRKLVAVDIDGMIALCAGKVEAASAKPAEGDDNRTDEQKEAGVVDYFNYGYDLSIRSTERSRLAATLEGPEKAIAKAVKSLMDNAGMTEVDARELVVAQRTKAGLAV